MCGSKSSKAPAAPTTVVTNNKDLYDQQTQAAQIEASQNQTPAFGSELTSGASATSTTGG